MLELMELLSCSFLSSSLSVLSCLSSGFVLVAFSFLEKYVFVYDIILSDKLEFGEEIYMKKMMSLIGGVLGILCGITIVVLAIIEIEIPKTLWFVFAICSFMNAILILHGIKLGGKDAK